MLPVLTARRVMVVLFVCAAVALAIGLGVTAHLDVAAFELTAAVLLVATISLLTSWAQPGRLFVEPQRELNIDDLIFFSYPEAQVPGGHVPRDYLLQMHVAVANVGQRTTVLSGLSLEAYIDSQGRDIASPILVAPVIAQSYRQWVSRNLNAGTTSLQSETVGPPFVIEPDSVLTLRIRWRGGIDWSPRWDLGTLKNVATSLIPEISKARLLVIYRSGRHLRHDTVVVPLVVAAQNDWRDRLAQVTADFTALPDVKSRPFDPYEGSGVPIAR